MGPKGPKESAITVEGSLFEGMNFGKLLLLAARIFIHGVPSGGIGRVQDQHRGKGQNYEVVSSASYRTRWKYGLTIPPQEFAPMEGSSGK